jgi:hypothetical protein
MQRTTVLRRINAISRGIAKLLISLSLEVCSESGQLVRKPSLAST